MMVECNQCQKTFEHDEATKMAGGGYQCPHCEHDVSPNQEIVALRQHIGKIHEKLLGINVGHTFLPAVQHVRLMTAIEWCEEVL